MRVSQDNSEPSVGVLYISHLDTSHQSLNVAYFMLAVGVERSIRVYEVYHFVPDNPRIRKAKVQSLGTKGPRVETNKPNGPL